MSSGSFKTLLTNYSFKIIYIQYICINKDLALDNLEGSMCLKTQSTNQPFFFSNRTFQNKTLKNFQQTT